MKSDFPLNVTVVLNNISGSVAKGSCHCRASALGRCAHVAALLLKLIEFTNTQGHKVVIPSTSKACVWNRGKKRSKDPNPIHQTSYSSKKQNPGRIYEWDPRPKYLQKETICSKELNNFIKDLQKISSNTNEESMWETSLQITYEDYELSEERKVILQQLVTKLEEGLTLVSNSGLYLVPNTL